MKMFNSVSLLSDPKSRSCLCSLVVFASLICGVFFIGSAWLGTETFELSPVFGLNWTQKYIDSDDCKESSKPNSIGNIRPAKCKVCHRECKRVGTEALPKGIVLATSNLEMTPLTGPIWEKGWNGGWGDKVIHVSAINQTKWWFAKRFLHPDIVAEYDYIFLWDEDLGVEYFHPERYVSIIKEEGLEISQPALDSGRSEVHHQITVRRSRSRVHRRCYKFTGGGRCHENSTTPPCVGWVEMMAPVFSRAAWRCVWYMIQNDLIHAWGLDVRLGYCAQGDRTVKVGVVDEEYIIHFGLPALGGLSNENKTSAESSHSRNMSDSEPLVRLRSYNEMKTFKNRWDNAVKEDDCWADPFKQLR